MLAIKNARILTITQGEIENGTVVVADGKIASVGANVEIPQGSEVIDAQGNYVLPGLIDAHTSIGLKEGGLRWEGDDHVEKSEPVVPHLRVVDGFNPEDVNIHDALETGITVCGIAPGDMNVIGGTASAVKLSGYLAHEMYIKDIAVKAALGEQPKQLTQGKKMPATRMGVAAVLRETLTKAKAYARKVAKGEEDPEKKPDRDLKMEAIVKVLNKELPLFVHAHRADDIMTAIRIANEFDIKIVLVHAYEAHKVAEHLKQNDVPVIYGPIFSARWYVETANLNMETPAILAKAGVKVILTSGHPGKPIYLLPMCAGLAVREGMSPEEALKGVTINAAEVLGLGERMGSIEAGKDANLVIMEGHPLQIKSRVKKTIIDGEVVFSAE